MSCQDSIGATTTSGLRDYDSLDESAQQSRHYADMRRFQTEEFVAQMEKKFLAFNHANFTIREAFQHLENYVDASDPDMDLPNIVHNFQTAERARSRGEPDWLQLTCLLHDLGKIMFLFGSGEIGMSGKSSGPQWALGGDTWILGEPIPSVSVFPHFNTLNPDHQRMISQSPSFVSRQRVGLSNLKFAWGHDEYAFRLFAHEKNGCTLPSVALQMIRLHSCYPLHSSNVYDHLLGEGDEEIIQAVKHFNQFDLYSKTDGVPDMNALWPYYESLIDKYFQRGSQGKLFF